MSNKCNLLVQTQVAYSLAFIITPFLSFFFSDIIVIGDITNIILDPILMFVLHMGVIGAAIAHVISQ